MKPLIVPNPQDAEQEERDRKAARIVDTGDIRWNLKLCQNWIEARSAPVWQPAWVSFERFPDWRSACESIAERFEVSLGVRCADCGRRFSTSPDKHESCIPF